MKKGEIGTREQQMLELLADGATSRRMAEALGYRDGTMRVYLHHLYRKLGVANKAEAMVWYFNRARGAVRAAEPPPSRQPVGRDLFGDVALEEGLYTALGVMSCFVGPFGKVWEVGLRIRGRAMDDVLHARRERGRALWRALLRGDFAYGKKICDADLEEARADPSNAVLLAVLLQIGGFTSAADRLIARLTDRRKAAPMPSARELTLVRALTEAVHSSEPRAVNALTRLTLEKSPDPVCRQVALAALFHVWGLRHDPDRARLAANALWAEAEAARKHLEAMGERPFGNPAGKAASAAISGQREKAAAPR